MEGEGEIQRLTKVYQSENVKIIISVVCKVALITKRKYTISIAYKHSLVSLMIKEDNTVIETNVRTILYNQDKIVNEYPEAEDLNKDLPPDNLFICDLERLIIGCSRVKIINIEKYESIRQLVVSLCKRRVKIERDIIEKEYAELITKLNNKFYCISTEEDE